MDPRSHDFQRNEHRGQWRGGHRRDGGFGRRGRLGSDPEARLGRGPRRSRGDVRTAVLLLLLEQPMHGYEMIQTIRERSGDAWSPSPGAIYPTLQLLTDEGLITNEDRDGKKVSTLTEAGRTAAEELAASKTAPWDEASTDAGDAPNLRKAIVRLIHAVKEISMAGTDAQRESTASLLDETRRKIYAMLASDES